MRKELENIILKQVRKIASEQGFPIHKNFMCLEKSKSVRGLYNIKVISEVSLLKMQILINLRWYILKMRIVEKEEGRFHYTKQMIQKFLMKTIS